MIFYGGRKREAGKEGKGEIRKEKLVNRLCVHPSAGGLEIVVREKGQRTSGSNVTYARLRRWPQV